MPKLPTLTCFKATATFKSTPSDIGSFGLMPSSRFDDSSGHKNQPGIPGHKIISRLFWVNDGFLMQMFIRFYR